MKVLLILAAVLLALFTVRDACAVQVQPGDTAAATTWFSENVEKDGGTGPVSFLYDGKFSANTINTWPVKREKTTEANGDHFKFFRTCPNTGLQMRIEGIVYKDFPVVEWVAYLKNTGTADTPMIEDIRALDSTLPTPSGDPSVHYMKGATCSMEDYHPLKRILNKGGSQHFQPGGGRSSSDFMPFFNLETQPDKGMVLGIGWSGEWAADFEREKQGKSMRVSCGMAHTHLILHPGEEIRTPRVALLFYESGAATRAHNLLRAFVLQYHRPACAGKPLEPLTLNGNWGGTSAADHLDNIRLITQHDLPIDYYWIDAEWFGKGKWHQTVGDWTPKADLYPQGFKPLADALHASGRKLLLWFEPERVCEGTTWYTELKDWLLEVPKEQRHYNWGTSQAEPDWVAWESARNQIRENDRLFNLGIPEARAFLIDYISDKITEFGLDCFRHDANIAPLEFWRAADAPDRQGMTEIRWVEGLYAFWDGLLERHPGLIIDNCASGGRRIDLESLNRSTPFWRTDFPAGPIAKQCHTYGMSLCAPLNATGAVNPAREDAYAFRSTWSSSLVFELFGAGDAKKALAHPETIDVGKTKAVLQQYRDLQKFFLGDYYPLTEYSQAEDAWLAWQFHRDDLNEGLIQVFRRPKSVCETGHLVLQGLNPTTVYMITNLDSGERVTIKGEELMNAGLEVKALERPAALVFIYTPQSIP
ncbi:MAG TPA: alpha-galactosidase [Candidatus Hydrogenedentes bacterium]|nr:alpha-galactosidase [Candidatus Hydrogenedentota bacterium]